MIALITPTGNRPLQFRLCQQYMKRQTYTGQVVWIIVDDCLPTTTDQVTDDFRDGWTIVKVYPKPVWRVGMNTQGRNMEAGIDAVLSYRDVEAIFIIEDDDYYRPIYLERMMANWSDCQILGETKTIYYNPVHRRYCVNQNITYASLFQTAFDVRTIELLRSVRMKKFIDGAFWKIAPHPKLFHENDLAVGMKGLPGRGGIGAGHSDSYYGMKPDVEMKFLTNLIGKTDADVYREFFKIPAVHPRQNRGDILTRRRN